MGLALRSVVIVCCLVGTAAAQVAGGAFTGTVRDQLDQPIPGASVTIHNVDTNLRRTAVTNSAGMYSVPGLPPGTYRVVVLVDGFRPLERQRVRLATGETIRIDLQLTLGGVTEAVTVTGEASLLQTETASVGQVITRAKVVGLPLNGRNFISLAALAPGVALPPGSLLPRINGGRPRTNEYLFDGISVLQPEPGQVAFFPVIDAIQELKIESNSPAAEFGRFNGGVVNLTTRSGTNVMHGTVFDFFRHESLNARNVFAPVGTKPRFRRNQFGGVMGGPLRRDRTFFFVDYQGQRQAIGRTVISTVPTLLQRAGIFTEPIGGRVPVIYDPATTMSSGGSATRAPFAGNSIPAGRMDLVALTLLARYPLPTSAGTANNYRRVANETNDQNQFDLRLDHNFASSRDHVSVRVSHFRERFVPVTPLPEGSGLTTGTLGPQSTRAWSLASTHQHALSTSVGRFPAGTVYSAEDPDLLLWVHATLLDSLPLVYEHVVAPLTSEERDRYCMEAASVAVALGAREAQVPHTWAALRSYLEATRASGAIEVGPQAREVASAILAPPLAAFMPPVAWVNRVVTLGLLPSDLRTQYRFDWNDEHERTLRRTVSTLRGIRRMLPRSVAWWPESRA